MSRMLGKQDLKEIIYGATFLGAGGGGPLSLALKMLDRLEAKGRKIELELINIDEMTEDDYAVSVVCVGSPSTWLDADLGPGGICSLEAFQRAYEMEGKNVRYLYPIEIGAVNLFMPMLVSILLDEDPKKRLAIIDADGCGRAVPELSTSLNSARGFLPCPMGLGSYEGDKLIAYPTSNAQAETIARNLSAAFGMQVGLSSWAMRREDMYDNLVPNSITNCQSIGRILLKAMEEKTDIVGEIGKTMEIRMACRGKITKIDLKMENGFDYGTTTIEGIDGRCYFIDFQNENLLMRDKEGKVYLTVPELICVLQEDTCLPLTNAETREGMEVLVSFMPAYRQWWNEDKGAYRCWDHLLKDISYRGKMVRF